VASAGRDLVCVPSSFDAATFRADRLRSTAQPLDSDSKARTVAGMKHAGVDSSADSGVENGEGAMQLDVFVDAANRALADVEIVDGRVAEQVDPRSVRYYTTLGLLDRPTQSGRRVVYGPKHLEQVVSVKKLQALGFSLTEIRAAFDGCAAGGFAERVMELSARIPNPSWRRRATAGGTVLVVTSGVRVVFDHEVDRVLLEQVRSVLIPLVAPAQQRSVGGVR
jgi:DNA-binding transcriptional MerR regulator